MLRASKHELPKLKSKIPSAWLLPNYIQDPGVEHSTRLSLAERAAKLGVIDIKTLEEVYRSAELDENEIDILNKEIKKIVEDISKIKFTIPKNWENENKNFNTIIENFNKTKLKYNRAVDNSFNDISDLIKKFERVDKLEELTFLFDEIIKEINKENSQIEEVLKNFEKRFNPFSGVSDIKKLIKKARKLLKKNSKEKIEAIKLINESKIILDKEIEWRLNGKKILLADLIKLLDKGKETFALRKQDQLNKEQALYLASCKSKTRDISLYF